MRSTQSHGGSYRGLVGRRVGRGGLRLKRGGKAELSSRMRSSFCALLGSLLQPPRVELLPHPLVVLVRREVVAMLLLRVAALVCSIPAACLRQRPQCCSTLPARRAEPREAVPCFRLSLRQAGGKLAQSELLEGQELAAAARGGGQAQGLSVPPLEREPARRYSPSAAAVTLPSTAVFVPRWHKQRTR